MSGIITDNVGRASGLLKAAAGGGKIGQVVQTQYTGEATYDGQSWAEISTDLRVAITPAATSSKILYWCNMIAGSTDYGWLQVVRDIGGSDTAIALTTSSSGSQLLASSGGTQWTSAQQPKTVPVVWLDSPATTSECIYKLFGFTHGTHNINRGSDNANNTNVAKGVSTFTVMEVLA